MSDDDLGDLPTPTTQEPELHPGGVDAVVPSEPVPIPHDLQPEDNAAVEDSLPDEIAELDQDKEQAPDGGAVSGQDETQEEPPA